MAADLGVPMVEEEDDGEETLSLSSSMAVVVVLLLLLELEWDESLGDDMRMGMTSCGSTPLVTTGSVSRRGQWVLMNSK